MDLRLPEAVSIVDVSMRDGMQMVKDFVPTEVKLAIVGKLVAAGVKAMEITSFVSPKAIPQLADATEVAKAVMEQYPELRAIALVPNLRGAESAAAVGVKEVTCVISASESHNQANVKRSIDESFTGLAAIREALPGLTLRLSLATAFVCPYDGKTPIEKALGCAERAFAIGVSEVTFCDTIGYADPLHVATLAAAAKRRWPEAKLGMHLHNTLGMGLANTLAAMTQGIALFETATGGLGGCPFAPGASGNTATEDMVNMLDRMSVTTGISLEKLLAAAGSIQEHVNAVLSSNMLHACSTKK